jgi:iron-sulfur cluster assembly accessory protein
MGMRPIKEGWNMDVTRTIDRNKNGKGECTGIILTEKAARELKKLCPINENSHWGLKFTDEPSRCSEGYTYIIDFVAAQSEQDAVFYSQGVEIYVPKASVPRLLGSVIDYNENHSSSKSSKTLLKDWLEVKNPNAKGPCPCSCGDGVGY